MSAARRYARPALGTVVKSGQVLNLFTLVRPEWGVSEVARSLGMPKSGAHSQLSALTEIGVLRRTAANRYRLGWRLVSLTHTLLKSTGLHDDVRPELERLQRLAGKQCSGQLSVLDGSEVIALDRVAGRDFRMEWPATAGRHLPAHSTASGKVLLAYGGPNGPELSDGHQLPSLTSATITTTAALRRALEEIRTHSIAWDIEETRPGVVCVAAPVRDPDGSVVAALSVTGPTHVLVRARPGYERLISRVARHISARRFHRDVEGEFGEPDPLNAEGDRDTVLAA